MKIYPLKDIIKEKADASGKTLIALGEEIEKTDRWIHNLFDINDLKLDMIRRLSAALKFDLLEDYNKWCRDNDEPTILHVAEPETYYKIQKKFSVNISLTGSLQSFNNEFGTVLEAIKKASEQYGFEVKS